MITDLIPVGWVKTTGHVVMIKVSFIHYLMPLDDGIWWCIISLFLFEVYGNVSTGFAGCCCYLVAKSWLLQKFNDRMLSMCSHDQTQTSLANASAISSVVVMLGRSSCRTLLSNAEPMVGQAKMTIQDKLHMRLTWDKLLGQEDTKSNSSHKTLGWWIKAKMD